MLKIRIHSTIVNTRPAVSGRTGNPFEVREQMAIVHAYDRQGRANPHGTPIIIPLKDREPYAVGDYQLAVNSIYVNRFAQLEISPVLEPLEQQQQQAAA